MWASGTAAIYIRNTRDGLALKHAKHPPTTTADTLERAAYLKRYKKLLIRLTCPKTYLQVMLSNQP